LDFRLKKEFFNRIPKVVAKDLLGKLIITQLGGEIKVGKIVETEAYLAQNDTACHASRGKTKRNEPMFGTSGTIYVYFTYGIHWLLNIVTEPENKPSAVLIRALEPLCNTGIDLKKLTTSEIRRFTSGPARLTKWLGVNGNFNCENINESQNIWITEKVKIGNILIIADKINRNNIITTTRIGVESSTDKDKKLRFYIKDNKFVSRS